MQAIIGLALTTLSIGTTQIDTAKLCAVEKELVRPIETGRAKHGDLLGYYEAANRKLFEHLWTLIDHHDSGESESGATWILADPGIGESFVSRVIDPFAEGRCRLELADLAGWENLGFEVESRPDLVSTDGATIFNELPAVANPEEFSIEKLLAARGCVDDGKYKPLIVIEDLDEVHPATSQLILRSLEEFLAKRTKADGFLHVVVFGRPEAFAMPSPAHATTFTLAGPTYSTSGDLRYLFSNYFTFHELEEPPQAEFNRFVNLVDGFGFLSYSLRNLALANYFIERSRSGHAQTEEGLKEFLYGSLLARNSEKNGRPGLHEGVYGVLLEEVAAKYAGAVGAGGVFTVQDEDTVRSGEVSVRVRELLDRSGVAVRDPEEGHYRFVPLWGQLHLIQKRSRRLDPDHEYARCP